ncbi:glycoside hydrolase family 2 TIM barrel-domain containing protein [Pseudoclostridium thermosuccinogenes]|uniref:glycoside hydrolase family 2 TIM barrel-domain containing protein n=1 Tax=Clostridium thermosuccinogenes TaxID=84032 RepID=UPI002FD89D28
MEKRKIAKLNRGWLFIDRDVANAFENEHDDSNWYHVDIPHDWAISRPYKKDTPCGSSQGYFDRWGTGWYRKYVEFDEIPETCILVFDGIYENSTVWVNGTKAGGWGYGYSGFSLNITPHIKAGKNIIAVKVDNTRQPADRWYSGAGIYRGVRLIETGLSYIKPWGVYITTPSISETEAGVKVQVEVENANMESMVEVTVDINGKRVAQALANVHDNVAVLEIGVPDPVLWETENPVLYNATIKLYNGNTVCDEEQVRFGIREVTINAGEGLLINKKPVKLKGVNLHHDGGCLGAAVPVWAWKRRLLQLKSMGCNAIRTSHNIPAPELLDLCDEMGFLVIDEAFDKWKSGSYERYFEEWWNKDLEFMLRRDRNHPCVIIWSVGNEVENQGKEDMIVILRELTDFVRKYEPTRPVTFAMHPYHVPDQNHLPVEEKVKLTMEMAKYVDLIGCNYHEQWYEAYHKANPDIVIITTEAYPYYRGKGNDFAAFEPFNPWFDVEKNSYVIGEFIWAGIDYLGEARPYPSKGWSSCPIDTCGIRKTRSWLTQSLWTDEPMVHIAVMDDTMDSDMEQPHWSSPKMASHWNFKHRAGEVLNIATFTNCDAVELILNGRSYGQKQLRDFPNRIMTWHLPYEPGEIQAYGYKDGKKVCDHKLCTAGEPYKIDIQADRQQILADGSDIFYADVQIVDENGILYPHASNLVRFEVYGPGKIIGVDNGNLCSDEPYVSDRRHAFRGRCCAVIKSDGREGVIRVRAVAEGLKSAEATVIASG